MKKRYMIAFVFMAFLLYGCNRFPEEPNKIVEEVKKNMTTLDSQQSDTTMEFDMTVAGEQKKTKVVSRLTLYKEPFEMQLHTNTQLNSKVQEMDDIFCTIGEDGEYYIYIKQNQKKSKQKVSKENLNYISEKYVSPIDYELYFSNINSFQKIEGGEEDVQILKGSVREDKVISILLNTGVLTQLQLTSFPEEVSKKVKPMDVTIWVNKKTVMLEKLELDMTKTFQELVELVFDKDSTVIPEINHCSITIDQLKTKDISEITVPDELLKLQ